MNVPHASNPRHNRQDRRQSSLLDTFNRYLDEPTTHIRRWLHYFSWKELLLLVIMATNTSEFLFIYTGQHASSIPKTITHVIVDLTVTAIESNAFDGCTKLVNVELHEGLESIGEYAFKRCYSIERILLPSTVRSVGGSAFCSCVRLADVQLNNGLKTIGPYAFYQCGFLEHIEIPPSVAVLPYDLFGGCFRLLSIKLNEGLTAIEKDAFQDCPSLRTICLPSTVKRIESRAFEQCPNLQTVELNEGLVYIGDEAFAGCGLAHIYIPSTVIAIAYSAFKGHGCLRVQVSEEIEEFVAQSSLRWWWHEGRSPSFALMTYNLLTKYRIVKRLDVLKSRKWLLSIGDMLSCISFQIKPHEEEFYSDVEPDSAGDDYGYSYEGESIELYGLNAYQTKVFITRFDGIFEHINNKIIGFEKFKEIAALLELAVWKSKSGEQRPPMLQEHRINCGADVIVPNVLKFLSADSWTPQRYGDCY